MNFTFHRILRRFLELSWLATFLLWNCSISEKTWLFLQQLHSLLTFLSQGKEILEFYWKHKLISDWLIKILTYLWLVDTTILTFISDWLIQYWPISDWLFSRQGESWLWWWWRGVRSVGGGWYWGWWRRIFPVHTWSHSPDCDVSQRYTNLWLVDKILIYDWLIK